MISFMRTTLTVLAVVVATTAALSAEQAPQQSATQFYLSYKAAFNKAKKIEDMFPYMSKDKLSKIEQAPAAERLLVWDMAKELYVFKNEKVVKETATATGATLDVEAVGPTNEKYKATVTLVKEGNAWKLQDESWTSVR